VSLDGKRIGIIGTGTTAAQIITAIAPNAGKLSIFQRTPSWFLDVANAPNPAWQKSVLRAMPKALRLANRVATAITAVTYGESFLGKSPVTRAYIKHLCRASLKKVRDPELRKKLTPDYEPGCKRLVFSSGYYRAVQQPNVQLITDKITRIAPGGVLTATGELHELDVLILATGFKTRAFMRPMHVTGEDGISIDQVWAEKPVVYRSVAIPRMPNFFVLIGPYSPIASMSVIEVAEWQVGYILQCIKLVLEQNVALAPASSAAEEYVGGLNQAAKQTVWASGCDSWYLGPDRLPYLFTRPPLQHRAELAQGPNLSHFEVRPRADQSSAAT
jgi:cation diffusion facilitator CzcD-associated flavoprotein CzcO